MRTWLLWIPRSRAKVSVVNRGSSNWRGREGHDELYSGTPLIQTLKSEISLTVHARTLIREIKGVLIVLVSWCLWREFYSYSYQVCTTIDTRDSHYHTGHTPDATRTVHIDHECSVKPGVVQSCNILVQIDVPQPVLDILSCPVEQLLRSLHHTHTHKGNQHFYLRKFECLIPEKQLRDP